MFIKENFDKIISGKELKKLYHDDKPFYKILNKNRIIDDIVCEIGLNEYPYEFPCDELMHNMYNFTTHEHVFQFINDSEYVFCHVDIPDDAQCVIEKYTIKNKGNPFKNQIRTNKLILLSHEEIQNKVEWNDYEFCMKAVKQNGLMLQYVKEEMQTVELCNEAFKQNANSLKHVITQTEHICLLAIYQNYNALKHVKNKTNKLIIEAVTQNGNALEFLNEQEQTRDICMIGIKNNFCSLKHVINQTNEMCLCAVLQNGIALQFMHNKTFMLCLTAVKQNGHALQYVDANDEHIITLCISAIKQNWRAFQFAKTQTFDMCLFAVHQCRYNIKFIKDDDIRQQIEKAINELDGEANKQL